MKKGVSGAGAGPKLFKEVPRGEPVRAPWSLPAAFALACALLPLASGHNVYEAQELETHLVNDEGSDVIEAYGGYDVQDVFAGFAYDPAVGAEGVYFRIELYGDRAEASLPQGTANWSVEVHLKAGSVDSTHRLWTTDGKAFRSDFPSLLVEAEGRDTHVRRAFLPYGADGLAAGANVTLVSVESRVDGDLRDRAPGGIPVPGTNGAQEYTDPTATDAKGRLQEGVLLKGADGYLKVAAQARPGGAFDVQVRSALKAGGQHVTVRGDPSSLEGETSGVLDPNGTLAFRIRPAAGGNLTFDILTDLGGRTPLRVDAQGTLQGPGLKVQGLPAEAPKESPAATALVVAALAGVALGMRRRVA